MKFRKAGPGFRIRRVKPGENGGVKGRWKKRDMRTKAPYRIRSREGNQ